MIDVTTLDGVRTQMEAWAWRGKFASKEYLDFEVDHDKRFVKLRFETVTHRYSVVGRPHDPATGRGGYLGCVMSNREPLPGETWTRGSDLADGSFTEETWTRIVHDILSCELAAAAEQKSGV